MANEKINKSINYSKVVSKIIRASEENDRDKILYF